jgi:hypothetical protein
VQLARDPRQAQRPPTRTGDRDVEHVGLGRQVQKQLISAKANLFGQAILDALEQVGIS